MGREDAQVNGGNEVDGGLVVGGATRKVAAEHGPVVNVATVGLAVGVVRAGTAGEQAQAVGSCGERAAKESVTRPGTSGSCGGDAGRTPAFHAAEEAVDTVQAPERRALAVLPPPT